MLDFWDLLKSSSVEDQILACSFFNLDEIKWDKQNINYLMHLINTKHIKSESLSPLLRGALRGVIKFQVNLKEINLDSNNLDSVPLELFRINTLERINLSNNNLTSLPNDIKYLTNLKMLNLSNNKLNKLPDGLVSLESLHDLNIRNNNIIELPSKFHYLTHMRIFKCDSTVKIH